MSEQSQKDEMNAAIRAQRERQNVPRSIAPDTPSEPVPPVPVPEPEPVAAAARKGLLGRLFRK
jgi:hypothetical protein